MPTSNLAVAPMILHLVWQVHPKSVLDVGPGWGKYGILLREYSGVERVDAVEIWEPYITTRLEMIYDNVFEDDVRTLDAKWLEFHPLVLMVDVLEHLEHAEGEALLDRIPGYVVVCTPETFFQNPEHEEIPPEKHRSIWTVPEFGDRLDVDASLYGSVVVRLKPKGL